ncbi:MAG: hypothetical protein ACQEP1_04585 [Nanobdellota archaeon]
MDETQDMLKVLTETVQELKKGIKEYSEKLNTLPPDQKRQAEEYIREMHQIALKINQAIEGIHQLEELKKKLNG